jgi:hypothetical protein
VQYTETDIPGYFDLARRFTLCGQQFWFAVVGVDIAIVHGPFTTRPTFLSRW